VPKILQDKGIGVGKMNQRFHRSHALFVAATLAFWTAIWAGCGPASDAVQPPSSSGPPGKTASESQTAEPAAPSRGLELIESKLPTRESVDSAQWAIIVGINHYQDKRWPTLQCAAQDAREVRDMLRDEFGFADARTRYLSEGAATQAAIADALAGWLSKNVRPNDDVLFYFAGHGTQDHSPQDKDGYLVPCDAEGEAPGKRYLAVSWLVEKLQDLKCRHKAIILDSCYSGALFGKVRPADMSMPGRAVGVGWDYYCSQPAFLGLTAAHDTPAEDAQAGVGHSPFTMALLDVMHDRADLPSQPVASGRTRDRRWPEGTFGFTSLASRVAERVQQTARQTPKWGALVGSEGDGDFLFRPAVPRLTPTAKQQRRQYAATIRQAYETLRSNVDDAETQLSGCSAPLRGWEWRYLMNRCRLNEVDRLVCDGLISGIDVSADGRTTATCAAGGQIALWDAGGHRREGPNLAALETHGLALDPAGRRLAIAYDETIALVEIESDKRQTLCEDMVWGEPALMGFSGDGHWLAALGQGGTLRLWDSTTGRQLDEQPDFGSASALALSRDGKLLAAAVGNRVVLAQLPDGKRQELTREGAGKICCVAFDSAGRRLAAVDQQGVVFVWQIPELTPEPPRRRELTQLPISRAALSSDLSHVAFVLDDRQIEIRKMDDTQAKSTVVRLAGHGATVTRLAFSLDGRQLISGDDRGLLKVWKTTSAATDFAYTKHTAGINDLAINQRQWIASADAQGEIHLWWWDPLTNTLHSERKLPAQGQEVLAVDFNPQGSELASGGRDGLVRIWDVPMGVQLRECGASNPEDLVPASITALAFDPAGQRVVAGYSDKNVRIWDVTGQKQEGSTQPAFVFGDRGKTSRFHQHGLHGVTFFSEGTQVFSAAERTDNRTRKPTSAEWIAWRASDGEVKSRFDTDRDGARYGVVCHEERAHAGRVAASQDGRWLATAGPDSFFTVWDAHHIRLMVQAAPQNAALRGHHFATAVAFSPDGERLAVASTDGAVRIWDVAGECLLVEFDALDGPVFAVRFSPDGSLLAAATAATVHLFTALPIGASAATATNP
jgi:WD40 repeat protein/uncharacterized caspase-like protein